MRLGNSGLKISRIVLGTMQYGDKGWQQWALGEEEATEHIKYACVARSLGHQSGRSCMTLYDADAKRCRYEAGIQTFDTADVRVRVYVWKAYALTMRDRSTRTGTPRSSSGAPSRSSTCLARRSSS